MIQEPRNYILNHKISEEDTYHIINDFIKKINQTAETRQHMCW